MSSMNQLRDWYASLQQHERMLVMLMAALITTTLFYVLVWEPVYDGLEQERQKLESNRTNLEWMREAAAEVNSLRASGARSNIRNPDAPVSLSVEQTIATSGIKNKLDKIESTDRDSARVVLRAVSFNQMIAWLNTLELAFGIQVSSANIDKTDSAGVVDARLTLSRKQ